MSLTSILFNIGAKKSDRKRDAQIPYPAGVQQWNDISYGPHGKENLLDVYRPVGAGKCPIIVNVHGGGYVYGDMELYKRYCMDLARRGFAVVNFLQKHFRICAFQPHMAPGVVSHLMPLILHSSYQRLIDCSPFPYQKKSGAGAPLLQSVQ